MLSVQEQGALSVCSEAGSSGNLLQPHHAPNPAILDPDRQIEGYMPGRNALFIEQIFKPDRRFIQFFGNSKHNLSLVLCI